MKHPVILIGVMVILAMVLIGCEVDTIDPGKLPINTSNPAGTTKSAENSLNTSDITSYKDLLSEDMRFYFDPSEVGTEYNGYTIPEYWDVDTDVLKTAILFNPDLVITIDSNSIGLPPAGHEGVYTSPPVVFDSKWQESA